MLSHKPGTSDLETVPDFPQIRNATVLDYSCGLGWQARAMAKEGALFEPDGRSSRPGGLSSSISENPGILPMGHVGFLPAALGEQQ